MKNKLLITILTLTFLISIISYNYLPDVITTHWDENSIPNGSMNKLLGLFVVPLIQLFIVGLFFLFPKIDPLKKNFKDFKKEYDLFIIIIAGFMLYMHVLTILWNFNIKIDIMKAMIPGLSVIFYTLGISLKNIKPNWLIGIRTPWTLSNKKVWKKTHILASILFKFIAVVILLSIILPKYAILIIVIPILITVITLTIYSYIEFRKNN